MYLCPKYNADVFIDGRAYRLETVAEHRRLMHTTGLKGVEWVNSWATQQRLEGTKTTKAKRKKKTDAIASLFGKPLSEYARVNTAKGTP